MRERERERECNLVKLWFSKVNKDLSG